jgi:hypothetical protein
MEAKIKVVLLMALSGLEWVATAEEKPTFGSIESITNTRTMLGAQ